MSNSENKVDQTGSEQRDAQQEQRRHDEQSAGAEHGDKQQGGSKQGSAEHIQTGARDYPTGPLSSQQLDKPGSEASMQLKPQFLAPDYCGIGKLAGLVAVVTGGDSGIGRAVAVLYAREGADVAVIYLNEHEDANETKRYVEAEGQTCLLIAGDVRDQQFCLDAADQVAARFGRIDVLVNNAAFHKHAESLNGIDHGVLASSAIWTEIEY
jgi:hypothetical protein